MFLFTTPVTSAKEAAPQPAASPVLAAIRRGADATGTGFDYLVRTAQRESALDPAARARTSSASGLFQFIEQTWLTLVRDEGAKHGLGRYAGAVTTGGDGRATVADPALKREILALRHDPTTAAALAGELTQRNRDHLQGQLRREPSEGELYIAHVLGAQGAVDLIKASRQSPAQSAAALFPEAAGANRAIFFDRTGRARGAGEVYAVLAAGQDAPARLAQASGNAEGDAPVAPPLRPNDGPALFGLFRTDGPRGPVSDAVSSLWTSFEVSRAGRERTQPYFPRSSLSGDAPSPPPTAAGTPPEPTRATPAIAAEPAAQTARKRLPQPLDLSRFMSWRSS